MNLPRLAFYFFGLGFLGFGGLFLVAPTNLTALTEIVLPTPIAIVALRQKGGHPRP